jgi:hypothetical protein
MEIDKISIAKRIKERRIELQGKDRGRAEFAQSLGFLPQTYAAYERDRFNFNFINHFAKKTNTNLLWILTGAGGPNEKYWVESAEKKEGHINATFYFSSDLLEKELNRIVENNLLIDKELYERNQFKVVYPKVPPYSYFEDKKIIIFHNNTDTGMEPIIMQNDIVLVDLDDKVPKEQNIYLLYFDSKLKLRYAKEQMWRNCKKLVIWAEQRRFDHDYIDLNDITPFPIIGRAIRIGRQL